MTAKIKTPFGEATITDYEWSAEDKDFQEFLNLIKKPRSGADPNPDLNAALDALKEFNLPEENLLSFEENEYDPGVIY